MKTEPRIVLFDLEVLADMREVEKVYFQLSNYPGLTIKASLNSIICFGYQIFGEKEILCKNAWDFKPWNKDVNDDYEICKFIYEIIKDADAVVTHNGKRFDWKFLQTRLLKHRLIPLHRIEHIDTCSLAKKNLMLFNNKLETLSRELTDEEKMKSGGQELWTNVRHRDKKSMDKMTKYCIQDVRSLNAVFKVLRPFAKNIPNYNIFSKTIEGKKICPTCGSTRTNKAGPLPTKTKLLQRYRCLDCGSSCTVQISNDASMPKAL